MTIDQPATASESDAAGEPTWVVWRQDDNGNRFEVTRRSSRAAADAVAATMEARGHKQTYWVAALRSAPPAAS